MIMKTDIDAELKLISGFVIKGNYHAAMNISISALNKCRQQDNQEGVNTFLGMIRKITEHMTEKYGG